MYGTKCEKQRRYRTKEKIAQSKRARACSLAIVDWPQVTRTCILRGVFLFIFADAIYCLSLALRYFSLCSFCFIFVLFFCIHGIRGPSSNRSSNTRAAPPDSLTQLANIMYSVCVFFSSFSLEVSLPQSIMYHCRFLFGWRVSQVSES